MWSHKPQGWPQQGRLSKALQTATMLFYVIKLYIYVAPSVLCSHTFTLL